ncbi:MAG: response regulator, partial [Rudanella sp.]|nr:response regulator [Rudanella sp.]
NILNDILDLSKIEAGKMALHEAPIALREIFDKLTALFGQQAASKNNRLTYSLADDLPTFVIADQTRLLQILSNLTSNAIKFTENGEVSVVASLLSKKGKFNRIRVEVRDSGIGISPDNIKLLFNSFSQVDESSRKSFGGTGLGLAISKELALLMKGEVGVDSVVGQGSTFWFVIELKETAISPTQQGPEFAEVSMVNFFKDFHPQVLLVDDNATNRKVASEILRKSGCIVTTASSGREAIACVGGKQEEFDVIFMDIQMPDMDGVETTRALREQFGDALPTVVAMTAYSMREDRERFLSQGLDDYIAKPIRAQSLIAKVKELVDAVSTKRETTQLQHRQQQIAQQTAQQQAPLPPVIDQEIIGQLRDLGGQELVDEIMEEFITEATELVNGASDAFALGDIPTVKSNLHTLKGSAGTIGVARMAYIAREAEGKLKHSDTSHLGEELVALTKAFEEFLKEIGTA